MPRTIIDRNSTEYLRRHVPKDAARTAFSKNLGDALEIKAEREALYQEQIAAEKAMRIASEEACLQQSKEDLLMLQESMAETKEEIAEVVAKWFAQNEIEPDAVLTTIQKNMLNRALYLLKHEEEKIAIDIEMAVGQIREASRGLRWAKGLQPTAEEKAQEDAEKAAEHRFAEVSRHACMPQMVRDDLYESSEYEPDLVAFWNEQADRCQRIVNAREEEMREMMNKESKSAMA
jgi:ribosomal protein L23